MKFDSKNITAHVGTLVETFDFRAKGRIVAVEHDMDDDSSLYTIRWEADSDGDADISQVSSTFLENFTVIANDDRQFVWSQKGEGYCSYCIAADDVEFQKIFDEEGYRLIARDDSCQCENCGIWAGEAYWSEHSDPAILENPMPLMKKPPAVLELEKVIDAMELAMSHVGSGTSYALMQAELIKMESERRTVLQAYVQLQDPFYLKELAIAVESFVSMKGHAPAAFELMHDSHKVKDIIQAFYDMDDAVRTEARNTGEYDS